MRDHGSMMREHDQMMLAAHRKTLWAHFLNVFLGVWLITPVELRGVERGKLHHGQMDAAPPQTAPK